MIRTLVAAAMLLLATSVALAVDAPNFKKLSIDETQGFFAGKTFLFNERKWGNDVVFFNKNGKVYFYGSSTPVVGKASWTVLAEPGKVLICVTQAERKVQGNQFAVRACEEAKVFTKRAVDAAAGDVLGISKGRNLGLLDSRKTTLVKLKASMR